MALPTSRTLLQGPVFINMAYPVALGTPLSAQARAVYLFVDDPLTGWPNAMARAVREPVTLTRRKRSSFDTLTHSLIQPHVCFDKIQFSL
jgi:hypothetical protein